jgi:hypothetical protein
MNVEEKQALIYTIRNEVLHNLYKNNDIEPLNNYIDNLFSNDENNIFNDVITRYYEKFKTHYSNKDVIDNLKKQYNNNDIVEIYDIIANELKQENEETQKPYLIVNCQIILNVKNKYLEKKQREKQYYKKHKDKINETAKKYYKGLKEEEIEIDGEKKTKAEIKNKKYYDTNKEDILKMKAEQRKNMTDEERKKLNEYSTLDYKQKHMTEEQFDKYKDEKETYNKSYYDTNKEEIKKKRIEKYVKENKQPPRQYKYLTDMTKEEYKEYRREQKRQSYLKKKKEKEEDKPKEDKPKEDKPKEDKPKEDKPKKQVKKSVKKEVIKEEETIKFNEETIEALTQKENKEELFILFNKQWLLIEAMKDIEKKKEAHQQFIQEFKKIDSQKRNPQARKADKNINDLVKLYDRVRKKKY